ncbi:hypothetical membrane protein [Metamycoplasma cloacale]|uniref:Uncharacterized protein n=1 Tax=Metamycoplasma cloacale TaxID=92401 RepID=A0A2Z4LMP9_9BACT|nr:hypothetical protein [Metamycoplasma cloacale]AWX42517.1 hypothetical protein DK849_00235 [Metamycoplasma cloacale]VEU79137.1 hypothetical membrane protein [Metamycoplasma cloacale]
MAKKPRDPWEEIDPNEVTPEDSVQYKKIAKNTTRSKKIKGIIFGVSAAVGLTVVLAVAFSIPQTVNNLVIWKDEANFLARKECVHYFEEFNEGTKRAELAETSRKDAVFEMISNYKNNVEMLNKLGLTLKENIRQIYDFEFKNVMIMGMEPDAISVDLVLYNRKNENDYLVIPRIVIQGFKEDSDFNDGQYIDDKQIDALLTSIQFKYIGRKEEFSSNIELINNTNNWYEKERVILNNFEVQGASLQGFLPFYITSNWVYENERLNFSTYVYKLGIWDTKINGKKYRYGAYYTKNEVKHYSQPVLNLK